ncbi:Inhibin beta chain [Folsomia candida]|uniref:Inhibin beta chain n=2 Tax=Folsomia candida TaxID=158441 RepID=A0A226EM83_FOLCA|nr:Inhibin beta chain [Folsomia candida]
MGVRVKRADLWVKFDYRSLMGRHFGHLLHPKGVNLYIFHIVGNSNSKKTPLNHTVHLTSQDVEMDLVVSRTIMLDSLGWQKLDITPVVQKWYNKNSRHRIRHGNHQGKNHHPREKLTLLVDCAGCANSIHPITFSQSNTVITNERKDSPDLMRDDFHQEPLDTSGQVHSEAFAERDENEIPFLVLETETAPNARRNRRRALECGPRVKHCCKQRFYVSFHELGWDDWIIAPKGYYANYCRGHCGGPFRTPDTYHSYHAHIIEEYRRTTDGQSNLEGITPCCAPTKFAPMSLIYFGPDYNIIKRDLPKMIVEECGCP